MKTFTVIAGADGVGKSSLLGALSRHDPFLGHIFGCEHIKEHLDVNTCLEKDLNCTFETTLDDVKKLTEMLCCAKQKGYVIRLYFISVNSAMECVSRVADRVSKGGRKIPKKYIIEHYENSISNLLKVLPFCETARFYDNENGFKYVGMYHNGEVLRIDDDFPDWLFEIFQYYNK